MSETEWYAAFAAAIVVYWAILAIAVQRGFGCVSAHAEREADEQ